MKEKLQKHLQQRELKFRLWDGKRIINNSFSVHHNGKINRAEWVNYYDSNDDEDCVIMQYTGLKDKNGKEICEGDIVRHSPYRIGAFKDENSYEYRNKEIEWDAKNGSWMVSGNYGWSLGIYCNIEIIGNIYENPELLK